MIPKKLTIEGLYSYQQAQTIDFDKLTDAGLFGIFGATGSGKSSILEAISYALYGNTERLNARDKRSYNMMNLKSNRVYLDFEFYNFENELYRVTREFKRNSKRFDDIRTPTTVFYQFKGVDWVPLEETNAERILGGLSYTNFRRTIIIPQGQFKEFLELKATDRTNMMKELFSLHRFDLQDRVSVLSRENLSKLDGVTALLDAQEELSMEQIQLKEKEGLERKEEWEALKTGHQKIEDHFQLLKALQADFVSLEKKKEEWSFLDQKKKKLLDKEETLNRYEHYHRLFYEPLKQLRIKKAAVEKKQEERVSLSKELGEREQELKKKSKEFEELRSDYKMLAVKKEEENDLTLIAQILQFFLEKERLNDRLEKGKSVVEETKDEIQKINQQKKKLEKEILKLKGQRPDPKLIRAAQIWFTTAGSLAKREGQQQQALRKREQTLKELSRKWETMYSNPNQMEEILQKEEVRLKALSERLGKEKEQLLVQERLVEHAQTLQDGKACPLCGSLDHPDVIEPHDVSLHLMELDKRWKNVEREKEDLSKKAAAFRLFQNQKKYLEEEWTREKKEWEKIKGEMENHQEAFIWKEFDPSHPEEFEKKVKEGEVIDDLLDEKEDFLKEKRAEEERKNENLQRYREKLAQLERKETAKQTQIETNRSLLKQLRWGDFSKKTKVEIEKEQKQLSEKNKRIEKNYEQLTIEIGELKVQVAGKKTAVGGLSKQIAELKEDVNSVSNEIDRALKTEALDSLASVESILNLELDCEKVRKEVEDFKVAYRTLSTRITGLEKKLNTAGFSMEKFEEAEKDRTESANHLAEVNKEVIELNREVRRLKEEWRKKEELQKRFNQLKKRSDNLQTLSNLFRSQGFVQYISSVYLSQLCNDANDRFERMTRNQLSLQVNSENDFEIIDYLNEGRSRSVKTLSGGQSFQASLSLALALADSVQTQAQATQKFFFIDEGFGTQDPESMDLIFETLLHLNKENKIVGIISHVESLKDRIPRSLVVEKDPRKGSLLRDGQ